MSQPGAAKPLIIGELINTSREEARAVVCSRDESALIALARRQLDGGVQMLDVCCSSLSDEAEAVCWAVQVLQQALPEVGLALDSPNPQVLAAALRYLRGKSPRPMINSVSLAAVDRGLGELGDLLRAYRPFVVASCISSAGIPEDVQGLLMVADRLVSSLVDMGIDESSIYIDPLVRPVALECRYASLCLRSLALFKKQYPDCQTLIGLSNVSYGLPRRSLINRTFLPMAVWAGADALICDSTDQELRASLAAVRLLLGYDPDCRAYLDFARKRG